jgi:iron(III) transport system ATP-binding protein
MRVELESVVKRFGTVTAVDSVSVTLDEGEFFFLLGPSGCGKTTLLRMLAGFDQPDSGKILFDGRDVADVPPERRGTGMVFQNYALWPHLTVAENIGFGLDVQGHKGTERAARIQRALDLVRMEGYASRKPGQLSGGQQQRVALARALVIRPSLVLLDEPLSNLDARLRLEMRTEIRDIIKRLGHTAVYVTHDQKEALAMADRCAILKDGQVVQAGHPQDLYRHPANLFVAEFLGETNLIPGTVAGTDHSGLTEVRLDHQDSTWKGTAPVPLKPGDKVCCCVRPEAWRLDSPGTPGLNTITGNLVSSVYLGEVTQHTIAAGSPPGLVVKVLQLHCPRRDPCAMTLSVEPSDTTLLPGHA